jgi:hypothetical protein
MAAFAIAVTSTASADPIVYEGFNYGGTAAPMAGKAVSSSAIGLSGTYAALLTGSATANYVPTGLAFSPYFFIPQGGAVVLLCTPSDANLNEGAALGIPLNAGTLTGTVYASCLVNLGSNNMSADTDSIGVRFASAQTSGSSIRMAICPKDANTGTNIVVQYADANSGQIGTSGTLTPAVNTTYLLIAKWTNVGSAGGGTATMWILTSSNYKSWVISGSGKESNLSAYATGVTQQSSTTQITFDSNTFLQFYVSEGATNNTGVLTGTFAELRIAPDLASVAVRNPKIGLFPTTVLGDQGEPDVNEYEQWLGSSIGCIMQIPGVSTWVNLTGTQSGQGLSYWINHWAQIPQSYRDRMIISLPMLMTGDGSTLASGATGAYDSYFKAAASSLVAAGYGNCPLRIGEEFTGNWFAWYVNVGQETNFVNFWIHIVNAMRSVPGANFKFIWNPTTGYHNQNVAACFPGKQYVDYIGCDIYDCGDAGYATAGYPGSLSASQDLSIQKAAWANMTSQTGGNKYYLDWFLSFSGSMGVPFCFPEWGLGNVVPPGSSNGYGGQDNTYFVQQMHNLITTASSNVAFASYFEWGDGTRNNAINSALCFSNQFPQSKVLFPQLFGTQYSASTFASGSATGWSQGTTPPWSVVTGSNTDGSIYHAYQAAQQAIVPISTTGSTSWTDYEINLRLQITAAQSTSSTSIYGRYIDASDYYQVQFEEVSGSTKVALIKVSGGISTTLCTANATWTTSTWYDVSLQMQGGNLIVALNGVDIINVYDSSPLTEGMIGLSAFQQNALFEDVMVTQPVDQVVTTTDLPPTAPTGLSGTAGNTKVTLVWQPPTGASGYNVKRSLASIGSYAIIATNIGTASYTDTGVTNGTTYYYAVSAVNASGESADSSAISARPTAPITAAESATPTLTISGGSVQLTMASSIIGHTYQMQRNDSLNSGTWINIGSPQNGIGGLLLLTDLGGYTNVPARFYRISIQQ